MTQILNAWRPIRGARNADVPLFTSVERRVLLATQSPMSVTTKITEHVYWMPPGRRTVRQCARWSASAHTHAGRWIVEDSYTGFPGRTSGESLARPSAIVYTHSHWDHVFGGAELGGQVIAHALTAEQLIANGGNGLERRRARPTGRRRPCFPATRCERQRRTAVATHRRGCSSRHRFSGRPRHRAWRGDCPSPTCRRRPLRRVQCDARRARPHALPRRLHLSVAGGRPHSRIGVSTVGRDSQVRRRALCGGARSDRPTHVRTSRT